jgi:glycosyltransferase involved in cell wall biosynthesis
MRIGFDAKRAFYNNTGLGNYSRNIINSLCHFFPDDEYYLYTPKIKDYNYSIDANNVNIKKPKALTSKIFKSYWRSALLVNQLISDNIQIYHGLSNELPFNINKSAVKKIVTIHDLIFLRYPDLYKTIDRKIYERKFKFSSQIADTIVAVSKQTKEDLINFFNIDSGKIEVIYQGCNPIFNEELSNDQKQIIRNKYNLPSEYILFVGTIEERKNLLSVVKALKEGNIDFPLVIIGRPTAYLTQVANYIVNNFLENIIFLKDIPIEDLPALYQNAKLFIYPSIFEGFGIPILEALTSGIPVITSKGGCFREVGGENSIYVDSNNIEEMIFSIKKVLSDAELHKKMSVEGKNYAKIFDNKKIATQLHQLYLNIL